MTTDPKQLLADAQLVDLATAMPGEFAAIIHRIQRFTLRLLQTDSASQWIAAVEQHGSERDALAAARAELADVTCRLEVAQRGREAVRKGKERLREDAQLHGIRSELVQEQLNREAKQRTLLNVIQQAERSREAKVRALVDDGVPEATALSVAKPPLAEIDRLHDELAAIPAQQEAISELLRSSAALVRHAYSEADSSI
ncbi:hypothetical protein [Ectopseudomonas oleovorans]|uniref:Uncharacterized protein n=1 Tax=Ectopseudomonas oleovorans TaxID=301 RepID=A0A3R8WRH0_ECTOL|nr:hypothetical protein [Pseudomonas oleovorans]RRW29103.1 hypothetical protein EGJ44_20775 [Pseudomonas oleovorans]